MDGTIARIKTSREAKVFAANAKRLGDSVAEAKALDRALELQAREDGYSTPAEIAIALALYAYEDQQGKVSGKVYRASRTRKMMRDHGALLAAERMVLAPNPSIGYTVLSEAGLGAQSFEAIIDRFPQEFSDRAVTAARARLAGVRRDWHGPVNGGSISTGMPLPDAEALMLIEGFKDPANRFQSVWRPHYANTISTIRQALLSGQVADVVDLIWSEGDNGVSNAAQGVLGLPVIHALRAQFEALTHDIAMDGSPESFYRVVTMMEEWRDEKMIPKLPMLLIARAFAAIHPERYPTLVVEEKLEKVLGWFSFHTGLTMPGGNWASKAQALMSHMNLIDTFDGENIFRSMFPWFVYEQLGDANQRVPFTPGHRERPESTIVDLPATSRQVLLRHNRLQTHLYGLLSAQYGRGFVKTEQATGSGGYADALVRLSDSQCILYEIKVALTAASAVRQAMGQLLEYAFRSGRFEPEKLVIVAEPELDPVTEKFLQRLNDEFRLRLEYLRIELPGDE
ncbi:hypothetical protein N8H71_06750 [Pseudomonas koreensis]|uniref:hypothetical protein n=1 Tax=Pseudomonas koreensis TaxID=198620 RepID=UPI0021C7F5E4|nr:hypothetical protein [Pseudomonas koreensis]MCU0071280.1 hypothetical protein [Pseudomonas koreensis]